MITFFNNLSDQQKGIGALALGTVILLLHSFGILREVLNILIFFGAVGLIVYGFYITGYWNKLVAMVNKKRQQPPTTTPKL